MKKHNHILYYFSLIGILILGLILILTLSPNRTEQILVLLGVAISYIILGIIHHLIDHDLVIKIVIEYILIACLGVSVIYFIIKGGFGI